jgi:tripartite-type tricarboxylate transporter receptor subunit TctC
MLRVVIMLALALPSLASGAAAQEPYPTRPISIVNPFPPGGIADLTARPLASTFEKLLKQPVVVVNKAGAAGAVGTQFASVAKPDGYTILIALVSISSTPEVDKLFGRPATYTRDQFIGIARLNADPPLLAVNGPWKTLKELVDDAKKRPGEITFASSGPYGASHLPLEMFLQSAGLKMRHLPTTGGGPATTAVLGGHARAGKMRALAVWGATRLAAFPDVPTLKELGYDVEYYIWTGLFAPKSAPPHVIQVLRDATRKAVQDEEFKSAMEKAKTPIAYLDADEFKAFWDKDAQRIASVIQFIGKTEMK